MGRNYFKGAKGPIPDHYVAAYRKGHLSIADIAYLCDRDPAKVRSRMSRQVGRLRRKHKSYVFAAMTKKELEEYQSGCKTRLDIIRSKKISLRTFYRILADARKRFATSEPPVA